MIKHNLKKEKKKIRKILLNTSCLCSLTDKLFSFILKIFKNKRIKWSDKKLRKRFSQFATWPIIVLFPDN